MTAVAPRVFVAGHFCLDIRPQLPPNPPGPTGWSVPPGALIEVGPAVVSPGGCVGNVGLALHRLGLIPGLMGKTDDDMFGTALADLLARADPALTDHIIRSSKDATSYTVIIEPPGVDRAFLHYPGANQNLRARDIDLSHISGAHVFHFGYPPVLPAMCTSDGADLAALFAGVRRHGVLTSLDMTGIDPDGPTARVDWPALFRNVLPHVDLFCPSLDELLDMIDRPKFEALQADRAGTLGRWPDWLEAASRKCLEWGAGVVVIKLGDQGLYLHGGEAPRLARWAGARCYHPCFDVEIAGTTGAGDCAVASLLVAAVEGLDAAQAVELASAVGAFSVEAADATGGVPSLAAVRKRISAGWPTRPPLPGLAGLWHDTARAS